MRGLTLLILVVLTVVTGCASSTPLISDEERCTRFGGLWQLGDCRQPGSGGGM
jgi:hypothetical protein